MQWTRKVSLAIRQAFSYHQHTRTRRLSEEMSTRSGSYQDAVDHLNSLQSNAAALEVVRASGGRSSDLAIPEMLEFLERIGYAVSVCRCSAASDLILSASTTQRPQRYPYCWDKRQRLNQCIHRFDTSFSTARVESRYVFIPFDQAIIVLQTFCDRSIYFPTSGGCSRKNKNQWCTTS